MNKVVGFLFLFLILLLDPLILLRRHNFLIGFLGQFMSSDLEPFTISLFLYDYLVYPLVKICYDEQVDCII